MLSQTMNDVSEPAEPGSTLESRQASLLVSKDAKSFTVTFPWNLSDSERGADWISIRLGESAELDLVNSALPRGSPVSLDQFLSKKGSLISPLRKRLCSVGRDQLSPGPSGPSADWLDTMGEHIITESMSNARGIITLELATPSDMALAVGGGVQTQRLTVPTGTDW